MFDRRESACRDFALPSESALGAFALVAGMAWIPGTAMAAAANISILAAGADGAGNPYDLTVLANDGNGLPITSMTAHLTQGSVNVSVPMQPVSTSNAASQTWAASTPVPAVSLPAGSYAVTVDAADGTETDTGLAAPSPLVVTYSATTVNVTPSATFVTEGSQTVKFTGSVTGTARDGLNTQVPIGGVTLNVSNGDHTTASPSGAISYTSPSLSQSTSFDFTLPAAADGSYPAGDSGPIQISAQQAATSISVTASPPSISQGAGQVTFSGQVTAVPAGGGSAVPVSGATVNVYTGATLVGQAGPTAADGSFSYGPTTVSSATNFTFSVTGTNLYGPAVQGRLDRHRPVRDHGERLAVPDLRDPGREHRHVHRPGHGDAAGWITGADRQRCPGPGRRRGRAHHHGDDGYRREFRLHRQRADRQHLLQLQRRREHPVHRG